MVPWDRRVGGLLEFSADPLVFYATGEWLTFVNTPVKRSSLVSPATSARRVQNHMIIDFEHLLDMSQNL